MDDYANITKTYDQIQKSSRNILNKLLSIQHDARFIDSLSIPFPIFANARCGNWYTSSTNSCYFKSTDGHTNQWDFNLKRLNWAFLVTICKSNGAVVVDSTRRGKRFPDSLTKTIPIWCCVINNALHQYRANHNLEFTFHWDTQLYTNPLQVSRNEHADILDLINSVFIPKLLSSKSFGFKELHTILMKPLRPLWISPSSNSIPSLGDEYYPVYCVSASEMVQDGIDTKYTPNGTSYLYVQGSGDDHEQWSLGLTPRTFWNNIDDFNKCKDLNSCIQFIEKTVSLQQQSLDEGHDFDYIFPNLAIGNRASGSPARFNKFDVIINCGSPQFVTDQFNTGNYLFLEIAEGKKGSTQLYKSIPTFLNFMETMGSDKKVLIHCMQGKDRSVGMALSFLIDRVLNKGVEVAGVDGTGAGKDIVQDLLGFIQARRKVAQPARSK